MKSQPMPRSSLAGVLLWLFLFRPFSDPSLCRGVADANKGVSEEVRDARASGIVSVSPRCEKLAIAEPLALHSGGDVVIGGLFPLHYVAPQPLHSYRNKPQPAPCSG